MLRSIPTAHFIHGSTSLIFANRYVFLTPTQTLTCVIVKSYNLAISTREGLSGLQ